MRLLIKKIFSHSIIYGLAPQIPRLASIFILPLITEFVGETDFGIYGIVTSYIMMLGAIKSLGLKVVMNNTFFKHRNHIKKIWGQLYGFLYLWNFLFAAILFVVLYYAIPEEAQTNRWTIILLSIIPIVFFGQTMEIGQVYYQLNKKPLEIGIRAALIGTIAVFLNYYTIVHMRLGYMGFFWSSFISAMLYNISYWLPLNYKEGLKPIFNFKWRFIKQSLKIGLPIIPHNASAYLLDTSDKVVMKELNILTQDIGSYTFAANIANIFNSVGKAVNTAISPFLLESYKNQEDIKARNLIFLWQGFFLILCFISCLWMKEVFQFLVNDNNPALSQLYPYAIILIMAQCYRPMYVGGLQKLFFLNQTQQLFKVTMAAGILNVVLNLIFIPLYGYEVALYTTYFAFLFQGYIFYMFKSFKEVNPVKFYPLIWLVIQVGLSVAVYFLRDININIKLLISIVVFILLFLFFKKSNVLKKMIQ